MKINLLYLAFGLLSAVLLISGAFALVPGISLPQDSLRTVGTMLLVLVLAGGLYWGFKWSKESAANDPDSPVIVAKRPDEMQAAVVVSQMEAEGIDAVAVGTFTSGFQVEIASMVKIVVPRRQQTRAREILQQESQ